MEEELPRVVLAANDCVMNRAVGSSLEQETESNLWEQSGQIPGVRIINTWQVYKNIWLVLTKTEGGHYHIFRSIDLQRYSLVHDHSSEIYNLFWLDDGHMIFCATDGWWVTTDTGLTWSELILGALVPKARSVAVVGLQENLWSLVAYGEDHKLYHCDYPGGEWVVAYDTSAIWSDKWYPAIAGGPPGTLAGAGSKLLRSIQAGETGTWQPIMDVEGIIKSIVISNQSGTPAFMIVVEPTIGEDQVDRIFLTNDLGDSLQEVMNRVGTLSSVQSVIPTGTAEVQTMFAVLGNRSVGGPASYKIIQV
ncbi:MAG: hypothetical protein LUQ21_00115 [Methanothrix sp.]|nr:hypothetical protein [Methanothrix sp.]